MNNLTTAVHLKLACIRVRADHWEEMDAVAARRGLRKNALMRLLMANAIRAARAEDSNAQVSQVRKAKAAR